MGDSWQKSVVLITSSDPSVSQFGTGFVIDKDEDSTYLLTCAHVVHHVGGPEKVAIDGIQARVIASSSEDGADLAVLCIEKRLDIPSLPLYASGEQGKTFSTAGFQLDGKQYLNRELQGTLGKQVGIHVRGQADRIGAWDLEITDKYPLQPGYSGSPIVDEYGNVIGVVNLRRGEGKTGLAISIGALKNVWRQMPLGLFEQGRKQPNPSVEKTALFAGSHASEQVRPPGEPTKSIGQNSKPSTAILGKDQSSVSRDQREHQSLLEKIREIWINGLLDHSVPQETRLSLQLQDQTDVLSVSSHSPVQESRQDRHPLPVSTSIVEMYDQAGGSLLILGEPGAGKTTLLLELTEALLERAEGNPARPLPIIFPLSSWNQQDSSLFDWLSRELQWNNMDWFWNSRNRLETGRILPLLDGLDEVALEVQANCVQAINVYYQDRLRKGQIPLVVCCSRQVYQKYRTLQGLLQRTVSIQPLTDDKIDEYLRQVGGQFQGLQDVLDHDPELHELARQPLMLSIFSLAYQGPGEPVDIPTRGTLEERQRHALEGYINLTLTQQEKWEAGTEKEVRRQLSYLAKQTRQRQKTVFSVEDLQPWWSLRENTRRYGVPIGLITLLVGVLSGPVGWLLGWLLGLVIALVGWAVALIRHWPPSRLSGPVLTGIGGWTWVIVVVLFVCALLCSWGAYLEDKIWWDPASFVEEAAERCLLHKVGTRYMFRHRLLLDYFASLEAPYAAESANRKLTSKEAPF